MRKILLLAIILMTLSCRESTAEPIDVTFAALGEITSFNATQMMMKTDHDQNITFNEVNNSEITLETGHRIYAVGSMTTPISYSYQATLYELSFITINKTYVYEEITEDDNWHDKLGNNTANIIKVALCSKYLTIFTTSKSDYLSLVITSTNISNDVINIDAELYNNTSAIEGSAITSFYISEYMKHPSAVIKLKYKNGNNSTNEITATWNK